MKKSNKEEERKKREEIISHFKRPDINYYVGAGAGFVFLSLILGYSYGVFSSWQFIAFIFLGVFLVYRNYQINIPPREKIDRYMEEDLQNFKKHSMQKLSIEESLLECESIIVAWPLHEEEQFLSVLRGDGSFYFTPAIIKALHMAEHQIFYYEACFNLRTGSLSKERSEEFFYEDIAAVSFEPIRRSYELDSTTMLEPPGSQVHITVNSKEKSFEILLKIPKAIHSLAGQQTAKNAEESIKIIREMLRKKK